MNRSTAVTRAHPFRRVSGDEGSPMLLQVSAGVPAHAALSLAECLLSHLRARCSDAVGGEPIAGDEAYACELLLETALALYASAGAHA